MAGLAEAAIAQALAVSWVAMFVIAVVTVCAWLRTSVGLVIVAILLMVAFSLFIQPWWAFENFNAVHSDPDARYWQSRVNAMAIAWVIEWGLVWLVAIRVHILRYRPSK